jgi:sterol 3beta-glucosyltransferase
VPALYGEKVRDYGEIRGWKSDGKVGVKVSFPCSANHGDWGMGADGKQSMGYGFYDGYVGFFTQPYKGARDGGAFCFAKGIVKGCAGLLTQPGHGMYSLSCSFLLPICKNTC